MAIGDQERRSGFGPVVSVAIGVVLVFALLAGVVVFQRLRQRPFVYIIGDSITTDATATLHRQLDDRYLLAIDARPGKRADELVEPARAGAQAGRPSRAVINLGTNDVNMSWPPAETTKAFEAFAETFWDMCVSVVTVNEHMPDPGSRTRAVAFNAWLRPWAKERGWRIIDWTTIVLSRLSVTDPAAQLLTDGIHPTTAGSLELVGAYDQALATC